jgi:hypothetical protein
METSGALTVVMKRWAFNVGLFYALVVAVGLAAALGTAPDALLGFPALLVYLGTIFVLPPIAFCLLFAELLAVLGVDRPMLRIMGLCVVAPSLLLTNTGEGRFLFIAAGLIAFAALARLPGADPPARFVPPPPPRLDTGEHRLRSHLGG